MKCRKLHNKKILLKEYVICPFCVVKIQDINNENKQKNTLLWKRNI